MSWSYAEYTYPVANQFQKQLVWSSLNFNAYFAFKLKEEDSWTFYAAQSTHALSTGEILTSYTTEEEAQLNYWTTVRDSNGKDFAFLPGLFEAKYARLYVEDGAGVTIYEWIPSTYLSAHEIMTGELLVTDLLDESPLIRVSRSSVDRIRIGNFIDTSYGVVGNDANSATIFELSDVNQQIGGFTFTSSTLQSTGGEIVLNSSSKYMAIQDTVFGEAGMQFQYNEGDPQFYVGDGSSNYVKYNSASGMVIRATVVASEVYGTVVGGFDITATRIQAADESIILSSGAKALYINTQTFGSSGIQLQYNSGSPRFYVGDGVNVKFQYDTTGLTINGVNIGNNLTITDTIERIAGFDFTSSRIMSTDGKMQLSASGLFLSINNEAYEDAGIQLQYNSGTPRAYIGDSGDNYFQYDGTKVKISSTNATALNIKSGGSIVVEQGGDLVLIGDADAQSRILFEGANASVEMKLATYITHIRPTGTQSLSSFHIGYGGDESSNFQSVFVNATGDITLTAGQANGGTQVDGYFNISADYDASYVSMSMTAFTQGGDDYYHGGNTRIQIAQSLEAGSNPPISQVTIQAKEVLRWPLAGDGWPTSNIGSLSDSTYQFTNMYLSNIASVGDYVSVRDRVKFRNPFTPSSSTATGDAGDITWDSNYLYIAVANDSWKRIELSAF